MRYENIDETTRREACERVKQIVKAIKAIKIKYYLNFSKISAKDQETYHDLQINLEKISSSHNLDKLKVALMQEITAKYDGKDIEDMKQGEDPNQDDILQACYGAIDAEKEALYKGRITQAFRCQQKLKKYKEQLDSKQYNDILNYKREKFAELVQPREKIEEQIEEWKSTMKEMCRKKSPTLRSATMNIIQEISNKENQKEEDQKEDSLII